jgi:hypothetical protein
MRQDLPGFRGLKSLKPIKSENSIPLNPMFHSFNKKLASLDFTAKKCDDFSLLVTETHK